MDGAIGVPKPDCAVKVRKPDWGTCRKGSSLFVKFGDISSNGLDQVGRFFVGVFLAPSQGVAAEVGKKLVVYQNPEIDRQSIFVLFGGGDYFPAIMFAFEVQGKREGV
jgi:hypothetical protein